MTEYQKRWQLEASEAIEQENRYLTFLADDQLFGISIAQVVQIVGMQKITWLPDHPDYMKGVISLRGDIIPVIDVRMRLGRSETAYNDRTCIIITSLSNGYFGFIVEEVDEVCEILPEQITAPIQGNDSFHGNAYLVGIARFASVHEKEEKLVLMIAISKLVEGHKFAQLTQTVNI